MTACRRRFSCCAVVAAMVCATATVAQTTSHGMQSTDCRDSWAYLQTNATLRPENTLRADGPFVASDGACEVRAPKFSDGSTTTSARTLRWWGKGVGRLALDLLPMAFEVEIEDFSVSRKDGGGSGIQMLSARSHLNLGASYFWDETQQRLLVQNLWATTGNGDNLSASLTLENLPATELGTLLPRLAASRMTALTLTLKTDNLAQTLATLPLPKPKMPKVGFAPDPTDRFVEMGQELMTALPDASLPGESRTALTGFLDAMPAASGRLKLRIETVEGISPLAFALIALRNPDAGAKDFVPALGAATTTVEWEPAP